MIYFDNAATTPVDEEVLAAMLPFLKGNFGNPQSQHSAGRAAGNAVLAARDKIADIAGCTAEEVYFVSGGTEAGNTALKGVCAARGKGHIVVSSIEHPCIIESAEDMRAHGFDVSFVKPDLSGVISPQSVKDALREDTVFCAVMAANNETGVIQPVEEIGNLCRERGVFYYADCVQTAGALPLPYAHADGIGISAHKIYGPKGAGALIIKKGNKISRLISGGMQERGLRGGTLNAAGVVGLAKAFELAVRNREDNNKNILEVKNRFVTRVLSEISDTSLNSGSADVLPSHANIAFDGCDGENLLFLLDLKGICVSTGSACSAGAVAPSRVLTSAGYSVQRAKSSVRFTFGKYNTAEEADFAVDVLKQCVGNIRCGKTSI